VNDSRSGPEREEPPPLLGTWARLYAVVVIELLLVIAALAWLTRRYS